MSTVAPKVLTAVPVGFTRDGAVDSRASREILRFVAESGVSGGLVVGTTGEFVSLDRAERELLAEIALEELRELITMVHVGAASAFEVLRLLSDAHTAGAGSVAVITPYFMPLTDDAVFGFFEKVSAAADGLRVYAYVFTARTGVAVSDELLARISTLPNLVGAKVSGESIGRLDGYRAAVPDTFELWTGSDRKLAAVRRHGGIGVVSGAASAFPEPFLSLIRALGSGNMPEQAEAQAQVDDVIDLTQGSPGLMREALRIRGVDAGYSRMPFAEPSRAVLDRLRRAVRDYG